MTGRASWLANSTCLACVLAAVLGTALVWTPAAIAKEDVQREYRNAVSIPIKGVITPFTLKFFERRLADAKRLNPDLLIVEIDSPGGYAEESLQIAETLRDLKWAHTVAYIPREGLSGAAFVALGCDDVLMGPQARIGDAGPIVMGEDSAFRHAPEKIVSDLAVRVRQLATAKKRPPALAEAMVKHNLEVFEVANTQTGESAYMSQAELDDLPDGNVWKKGKLVFESREDHFFETTGKRAAELGLAAATVNDFDGLLKHYRLQTEPVRLRMTWVDTLVTVLNSGVVTVLLVVLGLICLYVELHIPGFGIAGICSGLCFTVFFWSKFLGGTAGWLEVALFVAGVVLIGMEIFVIPGFGVTGVSGLLLIVVSFVFASQTFIFPQTTADYRSIGQSFLQLFIAGGIFTMAAAFMSRYFSSIPILGRMVLVPAGGLAADDEDPVTGGSFIAGNPLQDLLGAEGVAKTPLRPSGKANIGDRLNVDVVAEGDFIMEGSPIRVIQVEGNRVTVRDVSES